jgi:hypothetical protein
MRESSISRWSGDNTTGEANGRGMAASLQPEGITIKLDEEYDNRQLACPVQLAANL